MVENFTPKSESDLAWFVWQGWTVSTVMIISRVESESIRNTNETQDSNKNRNEICKNDETTPKYVGYIENILQETKTRDRKRISKVDAKQTCLRRVKSKSGTYSKWCPIELNIQM